MIASKFGSLLVLQPFSEGVGHKHRAVGDREGNDDGGDLREWNSVRTLQRGACATVGEVLVAE